MMQPFLQRCQRWARISLVPGAVVSILAAAAVFAPPVVYQWRHFHVGWHDVGLVTRANYWFFTHGRLSEAPGTGLLSRFILDGRIAHFVPFLAALSLPVGVFGASAYECLITAALAATAGYVFAITRAECTSTRLGLLAAAAYIANPYTYAIALSQHWETFGVLFLLGFAYHSRTGQTRRAWLMLALALTVKEDLWVYAASAAVIASAPRRPGRSAAFVAAALGYYALVVHPAARAISVEHGTGVPAGEWAIAAQVLGRWRDIPSLLFSGPGLHFQASFLFLGWLAGWRYFAVLGMLAIWLAFPGGPPRTELALYYSFPALSLMFICLPHALNRGRAAAWFTRSARTRQALWPAAAALALVVAADVWMHQPGHIPPGIEAQVDRGQVYRSWPNVNAAAVRTLIARYLPTDAGSVMAQFFTIAQVPQRPEMYLTGYDKDRFLDGRLRPDFVLLDLGAVDPLTPPWQDLAIASHVRQRVDYEPLYDAGGVLLYRRRTPGRER